MKLALLLLGILFLFPVRAATQLREVRRVLIFNELGPWSPGVAAINREIFSALGKSPYQIEFYSENLDSSLFPDQATQGEFLHWYFHKYRDRKPDLIIAVGPSPIKLMSDSHESFSPGTPIVFWGSTEEFAEPPKLDSLFTGVWGIARPARTLEAALQLVPNTKHVFVVGGVAPYDRYLEGLVKQRFQKYGSKLDFTYLTDLAMPELLERLKHLPSNTIVYHTSIMEDAAGEHFIDALQSVPLVTAAANAPVFSVDDVDVGTGAVGGDVFSFSLAGQVVGMMAVRILNGEKPQNIPIVRGSDIYMFDGRALKRWGLKETDLPRGSVVLNREPTVWELYKWYIFAGIVLILFETMLIVAMLWQRMRRRRAEHALQISNDRLRLAVEAGKCVGWDWDKRTGRNHLFGDLQTVLGIESDNHTGQAGEFRRMVHPEDLELVQQAITDAEQDRQPHNTEFRVVRTDGAVRWIAARGKFDCAGNGNPRMLGIASDVTDRKKAEHKLRESEERFRLVANTAPVMIWMSDTNELFNYFNQPWLEFTGRSLEAELGQGWMEMVHPEDLESWLEIYRNAFLRREMFKTEYRLRRCDGEYRWLLGHGVPRFDSDGSFAGYIGSCIDVTDRKLAEDALATVGRRLIEAHEEERTWIARELHDDIIQRLAVLAFEVDQWETESGSSSPLPDQLRTLQEHIGEIATDIQALSHRLHSSRLDFLGLAVAARSYCKELSEKAKVEIDFSNADLPSTLPKEVSLCLFRVMQEALQNAVKHSGVLNFKVDLSGTPDCVELRVADAGRGFEEQDALARRGLGLISMRERLQIVHGELTVHSQPGAGTTIYARVSLKTPEHRATASPEIEGKVFEET